MNINDRIKKIREDFCGGCNKSFAEKLGVSTQYASNITKSGKNVGEKMMDKILAEFPMVEPVWLKMGIGEMLKTDNEKEPAAIHAAQLELDFSKIADACQRSAASVEKLADNNGKLVESNTKLIDQLLTSLARIEEKIDQKGGVGDVGNAATKTGR